MARTKSGRLEVPDNLAGYDRTIVRYLCIPVSWLGYVLLEVSDEVVASSEAYGCCAVGVGPSDPVRQL